jgi:4-diphosphocytidyl-2-C-methyl-D-erythritol kinase
MRLFAPAKINWTLEVLRRRDDGYHEVCTVMQTIDICDEISVEAADALTIAPSPAYATEGEDLALRAARALRQVAGPGSGVTLHVSKRVPIGRGFGGGSSDAAAALRLLNGLWEAGLSIEQLAEIASGIGSDVPFFLRGGTALAEGRGERITPLADVPPAWLVVLVPPLETPDKTARMYAALTPGDFTDGSHADAFLAHLASGRPLAGAPLYNAFDRAADDVCDGLTSYREALLQAGAASVHVCGSGPSLFSVASGEQEARAIRARVARLRRGEKVHVVRTLMAAEATALWSDGGASR